MQAPPLTHASYLKFLSERRLMGARCAGCGALVLPPRPVCPHCYSEQVEWAELSGEGKLEGYTLIYAGLPRLAAEGYSREKPYCSGVVRLAEGPAVSALIVGAGQPGEVQVGMLVRAVFVEQGSGAGRRLVLAFEKKENDGLSID